MTDSALALVRGRNGRYDGDLPPEITREIARRVRAGETFDAIGAAVGISPDRAQRKCSAVAKLLGLPVPPSTFQRGREQRHAEVARRFEDGQSDREIGNAIGRSPGAIAVLRRSLGLRYHNRLRLSDDENAEIERRILAGESTRAVAAAVGCDQADVMRRREKVVHLIPDDLEPCRCGRPRNHGGRCRLLVDPALVRERLLAGRTAADIAREFGVAPQNFKASYVEPVIAELTAEGQFCPCGKPFGHQFACAATMRTRRRTFTDAERARAIALVRQGLPVSTVRTDLMIAVSSANVLVAEVRSALAAEGVVCPCGKPIDHSSVCSARNGGARGKTGFRFRSPAVLAMAAEARSVASKMAREGWPKTDIVRRTREPDGRVSQLIDELGAAGHLPEQCRGCERPYRHRGPCAEPKLCQCGRVRGHRGLCRRADGRKRVAETKLTAEQLAAVSRRYRDREGIRSISRSTGISFSVVQRLVKRWTERSRYPLPPCPCGRPARHGGSCWATKSGLVGKRHLTRIEQGLRDGRPSHEIAADLKLSIFTILKHAVPIRDRLFDEGHSCACGRPLNHNYWCSARWDAHDLPRGRQPFEGEEAAVKALIKGAVVAEIAEAAGVGAPSIWRLRRELTDDHRAERARNMRARIARGSLNGAALMSKIKSAVSNRIEPALRDDVVGEIYLAVIEGRVEVEQIPAVARSFISRGLRQWQSKYGPRPLEDAIGDHGNRTLADVVGDTTSALAIDEIEVGTSNETTGRT